MTRRFAILFLPMLLVGFLAACGGDDDSTVASEDDSATTTTTDMAMGDDDAPAEDDHMAPETNPCAEGGDGMLPGMESAAPAADATEVTIQAKEYEFGGTDALAAGGQFAVTFENQGTELHELLIVRVPEDEDRSMEELLADEAAGDTMTPVGTGFACPNTIADAIGVDMSEPGRYLVVCFVPTGAMADTDPADFDGLGAPHAMNGMANEVIVE